MSRLPQTEARACREADACGARRRLRRHRHEPAVRTQGSVRKRPPSGADRRAQHPRHPFPGVLGARVNRVDQVHRLHHAREQQGRRRHHGADGAGAARGEGPCARAGPDAAGIVRRGAVLRRQADHAGDFGALRRRGARSRDAGVQAVRHTNHADRRARTVFRSEARYGERWRPLRADHDRLVRHAGDPGADRHRARATGPGCAQSAPRDGVPRNARHPRIPLPGRGRARGHGRRGALRRHGPFRLATGAARMVGSRVAGARTQLFRPGCAAHRRPQGGGESVLPVGSGVGALPARRTGHDGYDHRVAGGDLRRLFHHAAGDATGLCPPDGGPAHVEPRNGPDLSARHQSDAVRRRRCPGTGLRILDQPRCSLRDRGHRNHGDHDGAGVRRRPADLALEPARQRSALRDLPADRRRVLQRQLRQARRRRLVSAGVRFRRVRADVDVETRPRAPVQTHCGGFDSPARLRRRAHRWNARRSPALPCS